MKRIFLLTFSILFYSITFAQDRIYWGNQNNDNIGSVNASDLGSPLTPLSPQNPGGIAYYHVNPTYPVFYANSFAINRANLSGSSNAVISTTGQFNRGVAIDYVNKKIYWAESNAGTIGRANLDGTDKNEAFMTGLTSPWDIDIDPINGKIYWTEDVASGNIKRANLADGSGVQTVITTINSLGVAVDPLRSKIFYTSFPDGAVYSANLDGSGEAAIAGLSAFADIDVNYVTGQIYMVSYGGSTLLTKSDPDGNNKSTVSASGLFVEYGDVTAPLINFIQRFNPPSNPAYVGGSATFTLAFSEPVLNFNAADLAFTSTPTGTISVSHVATNTVYDVTVSNISATGTLGINLAGGNDVIDFRGNPFSGVITTAQTYTVVVPPTPTVTSFSPTSGVIGTTVTITGTNFSATPSQNTVKFNGVDATASASTTTSITTQVPVGATTGAVSVTVLGQTGTSSTNFTVTLPPTPTITSFTPTSGVIGTTVTITGTNFSATPSENTVKFNGVDATVSASTITSITTQVPATATTGTISVTVLGQTGTSSANFTVTLPPTPTVNSFSPTSGPIGTTVTITGTNFSATPAQNTVKFNGVDATASASTTTSITTQVPASATTGTISVTVAGQTGTSASSFTVTVAPTPTITSFTPTAGPVGAGVTITGTNFSATPSENTVKFNGVNATVTASTTTSITTQVPAGATTGTISVTVFGQTGTSASNFTVSALPPPTITSFTPTSGPVGTTVTITGTNFSVTPSNNSVTFNGVAASVTLASLTSLTVTVPSAATTGVIAVTVVGSGSTSSATTFTVCTPPPKPTISRNNKVLTSSSDTGNQWLKDGVVISGATAKTFTVSDPGVYTVRVTSGGCSTLSDPVTVTTAELTPSITSFTPVVGPAGTTVTITGTNFSTTPGSNTVTFNSIAATVTASTLTSITTTVPATATTGVIAVTVGGRTGTSATNFTVCTNPPKPTISTNGGILTSSSDTGNQWIRNGTDIAGATGKTYEATAPGAYTVRVAVAGCGSALSDATVITGVEQVAGSGLSVYPNPSNDIIKIELESTQHDGKVEIYSTMGARRESVALTSHSGKLVGELNVQNYPSGIYVLAVYAGHVVKVVKVKKE